MLNPLPGQRSSSPTTPTLKFSLQGGWTAPNLSRRRKAAAKHVLLREETSRVTRPSALTLRHSLPKDGVEGVEEASLLIARKPVCGARDEEAA